MGAAEFRCFDSAGELGEAAAAEIAAGISQSARQGRRYLLGCPGGRTPKPIYDALGALCAGEQVDCSGVVIVMMDEYLHPAAATPTAVPADAHHSCRGFARAHIRGVLNRGLPADLVVPEESVWLPDPADPAAYDRRIEEAGGVDLFILASGASDGHVAFCGPGSSLGGATSVVELAPTTRTDNMVTFPDFESLDEVPTHGVSVGLGTIRRLSKAVLMVLHGADKAESLRRVRAADSHQPDWPATFVHECPNPRIWADTAAAANRRHA